MSETPESERWKPVLKRMFADLRTGAPRAEAYWAQQMAFGPVLIHAVALAVHRRQVTPAERELLRKLLPHAFSLLGALPDGCDGDPHSLHLLARRQARVLAYGRRKLLRRLAARIGLDFAGLPDGPVPDRFRRAYELIGWRPPASNAGDSRFSRAGG